MPAGVIAEVVDGYATLDFLDPALRGPALNRLLGIGGPGSIKTVTREGPRRKYIVPEGNAVAAGLLDGFELLAGLRGDTGHAQTLAEAHSVQKRRPGRPRNPTSANTYSGSTTFDQAREAPSVASTVSGGPGVGSTHPLPHAEVIARLKPAVLPAAGPVEAGSAIEPPADGEPSERWRRDELDAYARRLGVDTTELSTKTEVLDAIRKA